MTNTAKLLKSLLVAALLVLGVLVPAAAAQAEVKTGAKASDRLTLTWAPDGRQLQVDGFGYRPKGLVDIGLGSNPIQQAQADDTGRVRVSVPERYVAAGQSGTSIIVTGRSTSGASRVLISAVPPRAAVKGPVDLLPWSIGAGLLGIIAIGFLVRLRTRRA